jgi:hypothetical protein
VLDMNIGLTVSFPLKIKLQFFTFVTCTTYFSLVVVDLMQFNYSSTLNFEHQHEGEQR